MASFWTNEGLHRVNANHGSALNWDTSAIIKARLGPTGWTPDKDDTVMTGKTSCTGTSDQAVAAANTSVVKNTTDNRLDFKYAADLVFPTVSGGQNADWVAIYAEDAGDDANRVPLMYIDVAQTACNGGSITIDFTPNSEVVAYIAA